MVASVAVVLGLCRNLVDVGLKMTDIAQRMREALEPLPLDLLDDERARCAFYARELSSEEIMSLRKATWPALDAAARDAEKERRASRLVDSLPAAMSGQDGKLAHSQLAGGFTAASRF